MNTITPTPVSKVLETPLTVYSKRNVHIAIYAKEKRISRRVRII